MDAELAHLEAQQPDRLLDKPNLVGRHAMILSRLVAWSKRLGRA